MNNRSVENYLMTCGMLFHLIVIVMLMQGLYNYTTNYYSNQECSQNDYSWARLLFNSSGTPAEVKVLLKEHLSDGKLTRREYNELEKLRDDLTDINYKTRLLQSL